MQRALDQLFKDAVNRKPKRLSFDTTYSHSNIYDWLQTILTDWTIIVPVRSLRYPIGLQMDLLENQKKKTGER